MKVGTITRRNFMALTAAGAACLALNPVSEVMGQASKRKMNVLFVAVDDLRPQLGCYGNKIAKSPAIDRLAQEGLLFESAYCQQAVCAPSRISIMTGCRPDTTTVYDLNTPLRKAMPNAVSLCEHFKNNGYETLSIGKIYHHSKDDRQGWTTEPYRAGTFPEGKWKGRGYLTKEAIDQVNALTEKVKNSNGRGPAYEAADVEDNQYPDGANADHAIKELNRLKDKPFFMAMGFYKPHLPFNAPKKYWDLYNPEEIKLPDNYKQLPANCPTYAPTNWGELRNYVGIPKNGPCSDRLSRTLIHGYYACVSYIDAQLGKILNELDRLGLRDNTLVILWGDHGWKLGEHSLWCKHTNFELDTHVPLILSVPGMKTKGQRSRALVEYVDMYPTLCEACGLELPRALEGLSMMPLVEKPGRKWKQAAFSQYPRGKVMGYTMKTDKFRYTEWKNRNTGKVEARELYDHTVDPQENINVANDSLYTEQAGNLAQIMQKGWQGIRKEVIDSLKR